MSDQLWISATTGYRRRGTRLSDMRQLVGANVTAQAICEPLQTCRASAPAQDMAALLLMRDFDVAGVRETADGVLIGMVSRDRLADGVVRDHVLPVRPEQLVSDSSGLVQLFRSLSTRPYSLVLVGDQIEGIITRADFNKPPVRVYLFGLVSLLEMHLGYWVRHEYKGDSWQTILRPSRINEARTVLAARTSRGDESTLLSCLQFCDKRDLLIDNAAVREVFGLGSKTAAKRFLTQAEDLRNALAHSQPTLVGQRSWTDVIGIATAIERAIHRSDERIENQAQETAILTPVQWHN